MNRLTQLLIGCALHGAATAQLSITYGPEDAPLGCPVHVTLNNDSDASVIWDPCGMTVVDAAGNLVYVPPCPGVVGIPPGGTHIHTWPQLDLQGNPVPPGTYHFVNTTGPAIEVGNVDMAISPMGASTTGTARSFQICSPQDPGASYLVLASSSTSPGTPTCGGTIPLRRDRLMRLSLSSPAVFRGFRGQLDGAGLATLPTLVVPDDPALVGTRIFLAFIVLDQGTPCRFRRVSAPLEITVR